MKCCNPSQKLSVLLKRHWTDADRHGMLLPSQDEKKRVGFEMLVHFRSIK